MLLKKKVPSERRSPSRLAGFKKKIFLIIEKGDRKNKSEEQRLNLNRSWHRGHSHAYNTSFYVKSYTEDLSLAIFGIVFQHNASRLAPTPRAVQCYDIGPEGLELYAITVREQHIVTFSMDSGLEAFSLNPAHGSFSALNSTKRETQNGCLSSKFETQVHKLYTFFGREIERELKTHARSNLTQSLVVVLHRVQLM